MVSPYYSITQQTMVFLCQIAPKQILSKVKLAKPKIVLKLISGTAVFAYDCSSYKIWFESI